MKQPLASLGLLLLIGVSAHGQNALTTRDIISMDAAKVGSSLGSEQPG